MSLRHDGRRQDELRKVTIEVNPLIYPLGSLYLKQGETKILAVLTGEKISEEALSKGKNGSLKVTFDFLPFAKRKKETAKGEMISIIENSLNTLLDLENFPYDLSCHIEVLEEDGSVLATSINSGFMVLKLGLRHLLQENPQLKNPLKGFLGGVSCGILENGEVAVDLDFKEDQKALIQTNFVMNQDGEFLEAHLSSQNTPFSGDVLNGLLFRGKTAIEEIIQKEKEILLDNSFKKDEEVLVIATKNPGKAKEFAKIFKPLGFKVKTLLDFPEIKDIPETGQTFEENAKIKAETIAAILNQTVLADDSGLNVEALGGLPGIYSARFAGPEKNDASNNAKLLAELSEVPKDKRQGQFYCALAVATPKKETLTVHGIWEGEIATIPKGENGFGYDALFYVPALEKTAAELSNEEKNRLSHRSQAVKKLMEEWPNWWGEEK